MSNNLNLFGALKLTPIDQTPVNKPIERVENQDIEKPVISTEALDFENNNDAPPPKSSYNIPHTRTINDDTSSNWIIHASTMWMEQPQVMEVVNIFNQACKGDTIIFYTPFQVDMYSAAAILNAAHRCKADITVIGTHHRSICSAILLLCGKIRTTEYDMLSFKPIFSVSGGYVEDVKIGTKQIEQECNDAYNLLIISGLLTEEEVATMKKTQSQVTLHGEELSKRVKLFNETNLQTIKSLYAKYLD